MNRNWKTLFARFAVLMAVLFLSTTAAGAQGNWVAAGGGSVPAGAVAGGRESNGKNLYICRGSHGGGVHPGKIVGHNCNIGWGGREVLLSRYEVLVGVSAEWMAASGGSVRPGAVAGGRESDGKNLYICRGSYGGGVHPGKIVGHNCNIGWGGKEILLPSYEVLTYTAEGCWVEIFEDDQFSTFDNQDKIIGPGDWPTMEGLRGAKRSDWNDEIDSLIVGPNARVQIFEDERYSGDTREFGPGERIRSLDGYGFGDVVSSMKILEPARLFGCWVKVFEDYHFSKEDNSDVIEGPGRWPTMVHLPGAAYTDWSDEIDSLIVGPNARVTVWEDRYYGGDQRVFESGDEEHNLDNRDFGDAIDSILIECVEAVR